LIPVGIGGYGRHLTEVGARVTEVIWGAESPPVTSKVQEGIWVMGNGLVTVDVGQADAWLMVLLAACRYGGITPECDADLAEARDLIGEMGYRRTGETRIEEDVVMIELV
jgi:hypothetical protein